MGVNRDAMFLCNPVYINKTFSFSFSSSFALMEGFVVVGLLLVQLIEIGRQKIEIE